jgi:hypothetical protein
MHLSATNFGEITTRTLEHLLGAVLLDIFLGVYSQCKSKTFSGGSRRNMIAHTPNAGIVHMWVVCM